MKKTAPPPLLTPSRSSAFALLILTACLLILEPPSTQASIETPFDGSFVTQFTTTLDYPFLHVTAHGKGYATYMETAAASTDDQISNLIDGSGSATYTLTAGHGNTLTLALVLAPSSTFPVDGGVIFHGTYTVVHGTGRFRDNKGSGLFAGSALFLNETNGVGSFSLVGLLITR